MKGGVDRAIVRLHSIVQPKSTVSKRTILLLVLSLGLLVLGRELLRDHYADEEKALRSEMRQSVIKFFPEASQQLTQRYGLRRYAEDEGLDPTKPQVILIHGLDDPGRVWMNLAPMLHERGFSTWFMRYPDDQPIQASASLFHTAMQGLMSQGVSRVSIVAHSMGGLVSRDLLTHTAYRQDLGLPQVDKLIMVGTPNEGSELARFRLFAEFRDQFAEWLSGNGTQLGWLFDGAGEAGIDLTPDSVFLQTLNQRPPPAGTQMVVIAGVLGEPDKAALLEKISTAVQASALEEQINDTAQTLTRLHDELMARVGDGLVTLESARLPDADFHLVQGTHLSIIRNISADSQRMPPAIPIILQELEALR